MEEGISIDEACANNLIGTKEDFERSCNPDGTVKKHPETTTFSLRDSGNSITIDDSYLQVGGAVLVIILIIFVALITRKLKRRSK